MKNKIILSIGFIAIIPNFVIAEEIKTLETIVITATKSEKSLNEIGSSISYIDAKKLEQLQSVSIIDALKTLPALSITSNGGYGQPTSVRIRGAEPEHTQVIYDGVRLADASSTAGGFDFADLMSADCEKIEVLKGPQSSLYGSDAIGGVINIISKLRKREGYDGNISIEAGSFESYLAKAGLNAKIGNLSYNINALSFQTNGISALAKENGGKEKDPYENLGISSNFNYILNEFLSFDFRARFGKSRADYDANYLPPNYDLSDSNHYNEIEAKQFYFGINNLSEKGNFKQTISYRFYETNRQYFNPDSSVKLNGDYIGKIDAIEYQANWKLSNVFSLVSGLVHENSKYDFRNPSSLNPNPAFESANSTLNSAFIEGQANPIKGFYATIGARFDNHSEYGDHASLRATMAYSPNESKTIFRANYGDGFKAPSLYQLYSEYGNIDLKPEISKAFEFGITQKLPKDFKFDLAYFNRETSNQIGWFPCWPNYKPLCASRPYGFYENIASTETKGYEAALNGKIGALVINIGISQIDPKNTSLNDVNFGKLQPRRAKTQANINLNYDFSSKLKTSFEYRHVGKSFENISNSIPLKSYDLLAIRASYKLNEKFEIYGRAENLKDEKYQTAYGYGTLPRSFTIGLRAKF